MPPLFTVDSGGMAAALQSMKFRRLYLAVLIELALLVLLFTLFTRAFA